MNLKAYLYLILPLLIFSCSKKDRWDIDLSKVEAEPEVKDFSASFFNKSIDLETLKKDFDFFLDSNASDSVWIAQRNDSNEIWIYNQSRKSLGGNQKIKSEITDELKRMKYFFPEIETPDVWVYSSGLQSIMSPVLYSKSANKLFVALDGFLGIESKLYDSIRTYEYLRFEMQPKSLKPQIAKAIGHELIPVNIQERAFVDRIIQEGKKMILVDALAPEIEDSIKIGYSAEQIEWAKQQEGNIWNYFVEGDLLFSQDTKLAERFLNVAPYSKFYNEVSQDSPGRIGVWTGWQICRKFLERNKNMELKDFIMLDNREIFKGSGYKPARNNSAIETAKPNSEAAAYESDF